MQLHYKCFRGYTSYCNGITSADHLTSQWENLLRVKNQRVVISHIMGIWLLLTHCLFLFEFREYKHIYSLGVKRLCALVRLCTAGVNVSQYHNWHIADTDKS